MAACNCGGVAKFLIVRNNAGETVTVDGASGRFFVDSCGVTTLHYSIQRQGVELATDTIQNAVNNNYYIDLIGLQAGTYNFVLTSLLNSNGVGCTGTDSGTFTIGTVTTLPANTTLQQTSQQQTTGQFSTTIPTTIQQTTMPNLGLATAIDDRVYGGEIGVPQVVDVSINDVPCNNGNEFSVRYQFGCIVSLLINGKFQVIPLTKSWYFTYAIFCDGVQSSQVATVVGSVSDKPEPQIEASPELFNIQTVGNLTFACVGGFLTVSSIYRNVSSLSIKINSKIKVFFIGVTGQAASNVGTIEFGYLTFDREVKQDEQFTVLITSPHDCTQPIQNVSICLQR